VWMIVGLGNPGPRYEGTRHNVGFTVVDRLAERAGTRWKRSWRSRSQVGQGRLAETDVLLVKPRVYMNRSGLSVVALARQRDVRQEELLVVLDDADLPLGRLRIRGSGSAGNHNGLKSVIAALRTEGFPRLRVGIGPRPPGADMSEFVLSRFTPEERGRMEEAIVQAAGAVLLILREGVGMAMNRVNERRGYAERRREC